jgi:hypothetical protein
LASFPIIYALTKKTTFVNLNLNEDGRWVQFGLSFSQRLLAQGKFKVYEGLGYLPNERRWKGMKKMVSLVLGVAVLLAFSFGCAGVAKETKMKCPKCGAVFTVDEGVKAMQERP